MRPQPRGRSVRAGGRWTGRAAPLPRPTLGKTVNVKRTGGVVRIWVRTGTARTAGFRVLTGDRQIPVGSQVDTTGGRIRLISAGGRAGTTQTADFYDGRFEIRQTARSRGLTELKLTGRRPALRWPSLDRRGGAQPRRLWGDGKGRFRTRGQRSTATVRGTKWFVADRCAGTFTRVARGKVRVRTLCASARSPPCAPGHYLARKP